MRLKSLHPLAVKTFLAFSFIFLLSPYSFGAQLKLAWDANTETDLAGYKVYYGNSSRTYGTPISVGNVTTYTLSGLTAAQTYFVGVTAVNTSNKESGYSNEISGAATDPNPTFTVTTSPSGLQIVVDSVTYTAPQTFSWAVGSSHSLSVSSVQPGVAGTQYVYASWSDGGAQNHTITAPSSSTTYTANFATQYSLTTAVNPSGGGTISPSGTNYYNSGQSVSISATANSGYSFGSWSGNLSGSTNPAPLVMNGTKAVTANFTLVPETITAPNTPSGPTSGTTGTSYSFSTGGSSSNLGHSVQYQFDWGDGTYSG
ncbi:MAG: fibronectin type III domain-containing protein, partial [Thermodesulfobacteriota bacterium]